MSTQLQTHPQLHTLPPHPPLTYLNVTRGIASWLLTKDHKRIAILYLIPLTAMFFLGAWFMVLVRLELMTPAGDLLSPDGYNRSFTAHGVITARHSGRCPTT